ncbi:MAG: PEP-CTERM sorting domain-containing protein [Aquabacterium sp.]|nr:PEP-CTERM sorting domain-containing protein [Aquabacterium sp.]
MTIDDVTNNVLQVATVGGATQTAPVLKSVSSGGVMTVTDLRVDLVNKRVYANIISNNALNAAGDKTLNNFHLWDVMGKAQYGADGSFTGYDASTAIVGSTTMTVEPYPVWTGNFPPVWLDNHGITLNGLKITADGFDAFSKGLGLLSLGRSALLDVNDFGTLTVGTVPEPSTYALMGLGLFGLSLVARRRQK